MVAIDSGNGIHANPDAHALLPSDCELLLVATDVGKARFSEVFPHARQRPLRPRLRR